MHVHVHAALCVLLTNLALVTSQDQGVSKAVVRDIEPVTITTDAPGGQVRCWTCASTELYDKWWSSSFPTALPATLYDDRCRGESTMIAWSLVDGVDPRLMMPCESACISMVIHLPEVADKGLPLFVRGCLAYLLGDSGVSYNTEACYRGLWNRFEPWSFTVHPTETFDYCYVDLCNVATDYTTCVDPEYQANPTSIQNVDCWECQVWAEWDSCASVMDTCSGKYCYKKVGWMGDTYMDMRGCAPWSPYANEDTACYDIDTTMPIMMYTSIQVGYSVVLAGTQCYCKDADNCNRAAGQGGGAQTVVLLLLLALALSVVGLRWEVE